MTFERLFVWLLLFDWRLFDIFEKLTFYSGEKFQFSFKRAFTPLQISNDDTRDNEFKRYVYTYIYTKYNTKYKLQTNKRTGDSVQTMEEISIQQHARRTKGQDCFLNTRKLQLPRVFGVRVAVEVLKSGKYIRTCDTGGQLATLREQNHCVNLPGDQIQCYKLAVPPCLAVLHRIIVISARAP